MLQTDVTSPKHGQKGEPKDYWLKLHGDEHHQMVAFNTKVYAGEYSMYLYKTDFVNPG